MEIVLSKWFRGDGVADVEPVRRVALHDAGAWRLLIPEELDRKAAALTGFLWARLIPSVPHFGEYDNRLYGELGHRFRLLYGGCSPESNLT